MGDQYTIAGISVLTEGIADLRADLKGDIAVLGEQLTSIESELRGINRRLDVLEEQALHSLRSTGSPRSTASSCEGGAMRR